MHLPPFHARGRLVYVALMTSPGLQQLEASEAISAAGLAQAELVERFLRWASPEIVADFFRLRAEADEALQAAAQIGHLWCDLSNDTVDPRRPAVEVCRLADARFEEIPSFELFARVAALYWGEEAYPNRLFPEIAAVLPVILVSSTGRMRIPAPKTLLPRNIRLDYALAEAFLGSGDFASRTLADGDAEAEPMPTMLVPLAWETVKRDVQAMVRQIAAD